MKLASNNATVLKQEFDWLGSVLDLRFKVYFEQDTLTDVLAEVPPPSLEDDASPYVQTIRNYAMQAEHRLMLLLAMAPHVAPQLLDIFLTKNKLYNRGFTEFGGLLGQNHSGMMPTGETIIFVLSGGSLERRFQLMPLFAEDHYFFKHNLLQRFSEKKEEPQLSDGISISREYLTRFTTGEVYRPPFSSEFPAKRIETQLEWEDLILEDAIYDEVEEILAWIEHQHTIMNDWGLSNKLKRGYRALFYGPPGTGKTLTASLLGKATQMEVYRIDLSQIVSKYIGETEKNLASIFDQAEYKNWILFFDEADSLFGKRTTTSDAKDRYANQEVAYLLQRIEDFPGTIILATNLLSNIDEAFHRRFQNMTYFPMPDAEHRLLLWKNAFSGQLNLHQDVDLNEIAEQYEISGGAIINVLRYCSLSALRRKNGKADNNEITQKDIIRGIRKEFRKTGRTV
ncbi:MAG: ATP-binding protein [Bacteroidota bacterium]